MATTAEDIEKTINDCLTVLGRAGLFAAGARSILVVESQREAANGHPSMAGSLSYQADQLEIVSRQMDNARFQLNGLIADVHGVAATAKPAEAAERYGAIHGKAKDITDGLTGAQMTLDRLITAVRSALDGGNPDDVVGATTIAWQAAYDAAAFANWASELADKEAQRCKQIGTRKSS